MKMKKERIIFVSDVDLRISSETVRRIKLLTEPGIAYFPIFFSEYENRKSGFWRSFSYGMFSMYLSDFKKTGGFRMSRSGWGGEDVEFFSKAILKLKVVRAIDPGIRHIFHEKKCSLSLLPKTLTDCRKSKMTHKADRLDLYKSALDKLIINRQLL